MGRAKADMPFGDETMLQRIVRILSQVVSPIVVVSAADQTLPTLPDNVIVTHDELADQGPLEGIRVGLLALPPEKSYAFVSSCDVPLLQPALVANLLEERHQADILVPRDPQRHYPLAAVYQRQLATTMAELLRAQRRRPVYLFDIVRTREISLETLRRVDPDLLSFRNVNTPAEYQQLLAEFATRSSLPPTAI